MKVYEVPLTFAEHQAKISGERLKFKISSIFWVCLKSLKFLG